MPPQAEPPPDLEPSERDRQELLERRLADRIEERVVARIKQYAAVLSVAVGAVGTVLGFFGLKQVWDIRAAAEDAKREVSAFREAILPAYRAEILRVLELDSRLPYRVSCPSPLSIDEVATWLDTRQKVTLEPAVRDSFLEFARRNNICTLERVQEIFKHPMQETVTQLYREILDREPDPFGRFTWGFRLMRAYTTDDVRRALEGSEEARKLKQQADRAHP